MKHRWRELRRSTTRRASNQTRRRLACSKRRKWRRAHPRPRHRRAWRAGQCRRCAKFRDHKLPWPRHPGRRRTSRRDTTSSTHPRPGRRSTLRRRVHRPLIQRRSRRVQSRRRRRALPRPRCAAKRQPPAVAALSAAVEVVEPDVVVTDRANAGVKHSQLVSKLRARDVRSFSRTPSTRNSVHTRAGVFQSRAWPSPHVNSSRCKTASAVPPRPCWIARPR